MCKIYENRETKMNTYVKIVHGKKLATGKTNNCDTFVTETAPTSCGNILQWSSNEERRSGLLATLFSYYDHSSLILFRKMPVTIR